MPVSRIPPAAPTARFSMSESVAFFVAILDMCFLDYSFFSNKLPRLRFVWASISALQITKIYMEKERKRAFLRVSGCKCSDSPRRTCDAVWVRRNNLWEVYCCFFLLWLFRRPKRQTPQTDEEKNEKSGDVAFHPERGRKEVWKKLLFFVRTKSVRGNAKTTLD